MKLCIVLLTLAVLTNCQESGNESPAITQQNIDVDVNRENVNQQNIGTGTNTFLNLLQQLSSITQRGSNPTAVSEQAGINNITNVSPVGQTGTGGSVLQNIAGNDAVQQVVQQQIQSQSPTRQNGGVSRLVNLVRNFG